MGAPIVIGIISLLVVLQSLTYSTRLQRAPFITPLLLNTTLSALSDSLAQGFSAHLPRGGRHRDIRRGGSKGIVQSAKSTPPSPRLGTFLALSSIVPSEGQLVTKDDGGKEKRPRVGRGTSLRRLFVPRSYDFLRTCKFVTWSFITSPLSMAWITYLSRYGAIQAMVLDQFVYAPILGILFLAWHAWFPSSRHTSTPIPILTPALVPTAVHADGMVGIIPECGGREGGPSGGDGIEIEKRERFVDLVRTQGYRNWRDGLLVWGTVGYVSFRYVQEEYRMVFCSGIGVVWGVYFSIVTSRPLEVIPGDRVIDGDEIEFPFVPTR